MAQYDKLSEAYNCLLRGQLDSAQMMIDKVSNDPSTVKEPFTWYVRGFIYKELYKSREMNNKRSPLRLEALSSFQKSLALDTAAQSRMETMKNIRYIANKFRNDAALSMDTSNYDLAIENFENFKKTFRLMDPNYSFLNEDAEFNRVIAGVYSQMAEHGNPMEKEKNFNLSKQAYETAIQLDSTDISSNYNIGVLYYNRAGHLILDMEYTDLTELDEIQNKTVDLLKQSAPFMIRSRTLIKRKLGDDYFKDPRIFDVLEALHNIYIALHEDDKAKQVVEEKKALELKRDAK